MHRVNAIVTRYTGRHQPRRVRNVSVRASAPVESVVVSPGGFATCRRWSTRPRRFRVVISPGGFATRCGGCCPRRSSCRHQPRRVRNGVAYPGRSPARGSSSAQEGSQLVYYVSAALLVVSSSAQEGSQPVLRQGSPGNLGGRHQPRRVRNAAGLPPPSPAARVVISPGGFATRTRASPRTPTPTSSSAQEGSQRLRDGACGPVRSGRHQPRRVRNRTRSAWTPAGTWSSSAQEGSQPDPVGGRAPGE